MIYHIAFILNIAPTFLVLTFVWSVFQAPFFSKKSDLDRFFFGVLLLCIVTVIYGGLAPQLLNLSKLARIMLWVLSGLTSLSLESFLYIFRKHILSKN